MRKKARRVRTIFDFLLASPLTLLAWKKVSREAGLVHSHIFLQSICAIPSCSLTNLCKTLKHTPQRAILCTLPNLCCGSHTPMCILLHSETITYLPTSLGLITSDLLPPWLCLQEAIRECHQSQLSLNFLLASLLICGKLSGTIGNNDHITMSDCSSSWCVSMWHWSNHNISKF